MRQWVIKRHEDGWYVTRPGSAKAYSPDIRKARVFPTREAAQADACGNESVVSVEEEIGRG